MRRLILQALHFFGLSGIGWILDFGVYTSLSFVSDNFALNNIISSWVGVTFVFCTATRKVFRDNGMVSDSVMTNFEQIFETYSPKTVRKVI